MGMIERWKWKEMESVKRDDEYTGDRDGERQRGRACRTEARRSARLVLAKRDANDFGSTEITLPVTIPLDGESSVNYF